MKPFVAITLLLALAVHPELVFGAQNNIIISKGYISKLCGDSCRHSTETTLLEDCERGCRFFDYAQTSDVVQSNETALNLLCVNSCEEAYTKEKNKDACITGCGNAKTEFEGIMQTGTQLLEDADNHLNFLNTVLGMMNNFLWSVEDEDDSEEISTLNQDLGYGKRIDYQYNEWAPKGNKLDAKIPKDEVEIITMMANDMDPSESTLCATRMWLHRLSFILIVMGSMSLLFISFFYLLAFIKHKKTLSNTTTLGSSTSVDISSPPSYDTLVKGGFIVLTDGTGIQSDKDDKPFLA